MRQHYFAYLISVRKLLPLVIVPVARMVYSLISGKPIDVIIGTDVAVTVILIFIRALRVWAVKLTVTDNYVYIEKGLLIKSKSTIRMSNITLCYVNRTPLLMLLRASKLRIFTKSGRVARLYMSDKFI